MLRALKTIRPGGREKWSLSKRDVDFVRAFNLGENKFSNAAFGAVWKGRGNYTSIQV